MNGIEVLEQDPSYTEYPPSLKVEIEAAEVFTCKRPTPYVIPFCYDREGKPWSWECHRKEWFRAETIGVPGYWNAQEKPTWKD